MPAALVLLLVVDMHKTEVGVHSRQEIAARALPKKTLHRELKLDRPVSAYPARDSNNPQHH